MSARSDSGQQGSPVAHSFNVMVPIEMLKRILQQTEVTRLNLFHVDESPIMSLKGTRLLERRSDRAGGHLENRDINITEQHAPAKLQKSLQDLESA